jgi:hypothetical protein
VQIATINGTPTGGTFTISYGGQTTSALAYNAAAATVQTAVRLLNGLSAATVTGSAGGPYTITTNVVGGTSGPVQVNQTSAHRRHRRHVAATIAQSPDTDTNLRAIGGDWTQCAYGVGMDITIRCPNEASYVDENGTTHSAFQENLVLLLVEAYYGFVKSDALGAFVAYTDVSLEEIRAHLNLSESDGHDDDEELWRTVLSATRMVEMQAGAIVPRSVTERVNTVRPYDGVTPLPTTQWPVMGDVASVVSNGPLNSFAFELSQPYLVTYSYTVTYTVGRDPLPEDLMLAVLLQAGLIWASQRGPESSSRFSALGGDGIASPGGVDRKRLDDILANYRVPAFA